MAQVTLPQAALVGEKLNIIRVVRGEATTFAATMKTPENWPFDLTDAVLTAEVSDIDFTERKIHIKKTSAETAQIEILLPETNGLYQLKFVAADTWTMTEKVYGWSLDIEQGGVKKRLIDRAQFEVLPNR